MTTSTDRWLTFEIAAQEYAMSVEYVIELAPLRGARVHQMPNSPPHVAGVIDLRGEPIAIVDLRRALGMMSMDEEIESVLTMLRERQADHQKWIEELLASVQEGREFGLQTDPHLCAFGKWYDELHADGAAMDRFANGDLALLEVVDRFGFPHERIHRIATKVKALEAQGQGAEAERIIVETRENELQEMIRLFDRCGRMIRELQRGVIAVVEYEQQKFGVLVDNASEVKPFAVEERRSVEIPECASGIVQIVHDAATGQLIQLLDAAAIHDRWVRPPAVQPR